MNEKEDYMGKLVLTRRIGETIVINGNIRVTIRSISGHQVKVGIDAPREVSINRQEIQERIDAENGNTGGNARHDQA